jgi:hypothetical protein
MRVSTLLATAAAATMKTLAPLPAEAKYKRKDKEERKAALVLRREHPLSLSNLAPSVQSAIVAVAVRKAKKGCTVEEARARGAGASVSRMNSEADVAAHAANLVARQDATVDAKKQRFQKKSRGGVRGA